ncbi:Pls/PosA family non-ribosomal peptide synthetase [Arthrobacter sp. H5]|uniref:Pls/PosA family non-ribosomal peptide synthetase n=1 Tax=Arthrobacter sp. H5 TaxID=1267973 RepID=UPI0004BABD41|nr:Pls/PosA family non-ribosomal peptide synthetase [Arthrobacter sp. H5]
MARHEAAARTTDRPLARLYRTITPRRQSSPIPAASVPDQTIRWQPGERLNTLFEDCCDQLKAEGRGSQLAVDAGSVVLTYDQLDARANSLARHLLGRGARPGQRIALLFDVPWRAYVGMLAVLKIHATYVPLDPGFPSDRLKYIVEDADITMVLSLSHLSALIAEVGVPVVCLNNEDHEIDAEDPSRLPHPTGSNGSNGSNGSSDLAYIIYTSGSTGKPKGVAIEHASICNFVRVAADVYGISSSDRVYQGMTIAFDFSVEEIWVPWMATATLVPKPQGWNLLGAELAQFLRENRVTAMCCVPTLLATIDEDLPGLRFLLVSGEACPRDLIARWHKADRRFLNVYGPTEATVTATWAVADPHRPVTLGTPLPTYSAVILDPDEPKLLPPGATGEIALAGIGLARGYIKRQDLTDKAFIPDFLQLANNPSGRIYRTGDLGRLNEEGQIEYFGRIDTQVKIRGYRIELTEIESVLLQLPGIAQAVVKTHEPVPGLTELAAYYSLRQDTDHIDESLIRAALKERLPGYMIPAYFDRLDVIPVLTSGKADRKNLPEPSVRSDYRNDDGYTAPATPEEHILASALAGVLGVEKVSTSAHFFNDLGANSLLMAHFSARVRREGCAPVAMRDIYLNPTITKLAAAQQKPATAAASTPSPYADSAPGTVSNAQYVLCGFLQALIFLTAASGAATVLFAGYKFASGGQNIAEVLWRSLFFGSASFIALCLLPIAVKWLLIGRWRIESFPVWTFPYLRFWIVKSLIRANPMRLFVGTPLYILYLRALGAKIGRNVVILAPSVPVCTDLLTIGDGTVIRKDSSFSCYRAYRGSIQTGPVTIGANAVIGEAAILDVDARVGNGAQLGHASSLYASQSIPDGQWWQGSPAQRAGTDYRTVSPADCGTRRRVTYSIFAFLGRLLLIVPLGVGSLSLLIPGYTSLEHLDHANLMFYIDAFIVSFIFFFGAVIVGLALVVTGPRLLNLALKPGKVYPLYSWPFAVQRAIARLTNLRFFMELTGDSSLIVHYLKLLGYKQPGLVQTGSNFGVALKHESPFAATIGSGTMVADGLSIMNADFSNTSFKISETSIGSRSFFGNNIVYPPNASIGDNCLLATKVMVPLDGPVREGVGILGSPPFEIPRSVQRDSEFKEIGAGEGAGTLLKAKNRHNAVTIALFLLSRWIYLFAALLIGSYAIALHNFYDALAFAGATIGLFLFTTGYFILVERAAFGFRRLTPLFCSIYNRSFWRHERFWKLSATTYLDIFNGTPFKNIIWRLLGVRVGKHVFDDGCSIPEKTIVSIGDNCTLNALSTIQCHSMEDGAFKREGITIGAGCTIGINAFVHYDVMMGEGAELEPDSFLMKGEDVPAGNLFGGNPAREISRTTSDASRQNTKKVT